MASLAQYVPGDGGDDIKLDRDYYRFRRGLEKRYPQICADCEAAASEAIQRADYTAKTDHLRKMVEMSRARLRGPAPRRSLVDWMHLTVRLVWWSGLLLQLLWHLKTVARVLEQSDSGMSDPDDSGPWSLAAKWLGVGASYLPPDDVLLWWSLATSLATVWWNPKFVQASRGYTRQLSGFRKWYAFQLVIILGRLALSRMDVSGLPRNAQLSAQAAAAGMSTFVRLLQGTEWAELTMTDILDGL